MRAFAWILSIALLSFPAGCNDDSARRVNPVFAVPDVVGLLTPRSSHAVTTVGGDLVLVTGGVSLCVPATGAAEIIDASLDGTVVSYATDSAAYTLSTSLLLPRKLTDVVANSLAVSRQGHTAIAGPNGVLIFGGQDQLGSALESLEIFDVAWTNDGSRAVFTANRDDPNHFEPFSVDSEGNDLRKLGSTKTDPGTPFQSRFVPSPKGNEILLFLDTDDGTPQLFIGPADGSAPLQQLSPAPGETGGVDGDAQFSTDGSAVHYQSGGALFTCDLLTGVTNRASEDGPGGVTLFEPTTTGGVVFVEGAAVFGSGALGTQLLFEFDGDVVDLQVADLDTLGPHVACHVRPPAGTGTTLHVAAVDGSSSHEHEIDDGIDAMLWYADRDDLGVVSRDPNHERDAFSICDPATGTLTPQYLLGLDPNVDAEYHTVGDSIIRVEDIGSNTTLASIVTPDSVTPVCLNYESAIAMPEFPVDPAAEICSQQLVPAMTFTDVNDPTDSYVRHGLLTRRRGGQFVLRDFDPGRVFANRAKAVGDVTTAPLEFEGLDPSFQHFYSYTQDAIPLGDTRTVLVFGEGAYSDPLGQRTVTQPVLQTLPILVPVGQDGELMELTQHLNWGEYLLSMDGRIVPVPD